IMSTPGGSDVALVKAATPSPSPLTKIDVDYTGSKFEMHASLSEEERRFYLKMYPNVDIVNQRRVHCTVCRQHLGTALAAENNIKMHPILRVTHCVKCHDFYNSGEFSKGEDGSELYCRWCGQGGEVYCCSTCPYVFCKSCIVKNLSKGVIVDIEQNEHWNCFNCTSKILWPLRAQHWALVNYIQSTKKALQSMQMPELEARRHMLKDNTSCCRLAKSKATSLSDSMESLESNASRRSQGSSANAVKRALPSKPSPGPTTKRPKSSNDEVVCTPDLLSMLEPDCQLSMLPKPPNRQPGPASSITTTPRIVTVQQNYTGPSPSSGTTSNGSGSSASMGAPRGSLPPPLVLSGSGIRYRQSSPGNVTNVRRTVVPNVVRNSGPVFHTINGFRVDLNSAAQQDSYRLPNGRLIQVKRQMPLANQPAGGGPTAPTSPIVIPPMNPGVVIRPRGPPTVGRPPTQGNNNFGNNMGIYNPQINQQQRAPQVVRISQSQAAAPPSPAQVPASNVNGSGGGGGQTLMITPVPGPAKTPTLVRHNFPNTTLGQARSQLQEQIFSAMDICTHLTGKVVSLTHSNAYNQVRNYIDLKELYIHMSYLMTYAIGRFKHLQEKCLVDMREMGFKNDANSLENGQLAAEKQASDDEDNEIEIVEPKTDTITIDSDNEDDTPSTSTQQKAMMKIVSVTSAAPKKELSENQADIDVAAFSSTILASLLEVDIHEGGTTGDPKSISPGQKKQPRKKTTNKPNPALLQLERQRMEEMKRSDVKLKKKCRVKLRRAEEDFEVARKWVERNRKRDQEQAVSSLAEAPSEKGVEESKDVPQPLEIEVQLIALSPEKESPNKDRESEDSEIKESGKETPSEAKDKDKIGEMLKAAIKAKITQKAQKGEGRTEEQEEMVTEEDKAAGEEVKGAKEKETNLEKGSENDSLDEEIKEPKSKSEKVTEKEKADEKDKEEVKQKLAEKEKSKEQDKEEVVSEKQKPVEKEMKLQSNNTSETETEKVLDPVASEEKEPRQSKKEQNKKDNETATLSEKSPKTYLSDEKDKEKPTETISDEASTEAASPPEAEPSQAENEVVTEVSEPLPKQDSTADLVETMDTTPDNEEPSAAELVESMDVIELDEPPKELLDCAIDEVIAMDGIELSSATEELMKALASSSENVTDLDADELIETLPLETTEPPEILLKEDD
ncbi:hypothetical protein KR059_001042, partial [Drosophila kikkawai]